MAREEVSRSAFSRAVQRARGLHGWSQQQLAERSGIGERTIARWEKEGGDPYIGQVRKLVAATGIPAEDVLRAVGLLPEHAEVRDDLTADEQELWALGHRRGWSEELRWDLIDFLRVRKARARRTAEDDPNAIAAEMNAVLKRDFSDTEVADEGDALGEATRRYGT
nr:helix-turn-helix transcriptional regulator [Phytoactinopolyspora alkaliphila]